MGRLACPFRNAISGNVVIPVGEFLREERLEGVEVERFELAETLHPDRRFAHGERFKFAPDDAPAPLLADQPRACQHTEMLRDCVEGGGSGHVFG